MTILINGNGTDARASFIKRYYTLVYCTHLLYSTSTYIIILIVSAEATTNFFGFFFWILLMMLMLFLQTLVLFSFH